MIHNQEPSAMEARRYKKPCNTNTPMQPQMPLRAALFACAHCSLVCRTEVLLTSKGRPKTQLNILLL